MAAIQNCIIFVLLTCLELAPIVDAKRNYNLEVESIEVDKNPRYILQIKQFRVSKYNATTHVVNGNFTYIDDLPTDTVINAAAYQLMASNKYSMIPVGLKPFNYCDVIANDKLYYPGFVAKSNFPTKCPVLKGDFWLKDFIPDFDALPDQLPGERWRLDYEMKSKKQIIYTTPPPETTTTKLTTETTTNATSATTSDYTEITESTPPEDDAILSIVLCGIFTAVIIAACVAGGVIYLKKRKLKAAVPRQFGPRISDKIKR